MKTLFILLGLGLLVISCSADKGAEKKSGVTGVKTEKTETQKNEIQWFKGSMEQALVEAKANAKPLFVYWGAEWCPPCSVVKSTIFKDPAVIASTEKYVSVYLDGDTESAQVWGEKLHALGYPTLMVLNSEGSEVVRLSGSSTPAEFSESLDSAFNNLHPIEETIEKVLAMSAEKVSAEQWRLIAGFSWGQAKTNEDEKNKKNWAQIYRQLYEKIPETYADEKRQFFIESFAARLDEVKDKPLTEIEKKEARQFFDEVLNDQKLFAKNFKIFAYYSGEIIKAFYGKDSPERQAYVQKIKSAFSDLRKTMSASSYDRLITYYPNIAFLELDEGEERKPSAAEVDMIKKDVLNAFDNVENNYQQIYVTNSSSYILQQIGLSELARTMLKKDIEKSKTPYYSMAALAGLEKKEGKKDEALTWMKKAYDASKGDATRLQWGSSYLSYLMDIKADAEDEVLLELEKYYSAQLKRSDAFVGRNKHRMKRVAKTVKEWGQSKERKARIEPLKKKWLARCDKKSQTKTDYFTSACKEYFAELI